MPEEVVRSSLRNGESPPLETGTSRARKKVRGVGLVERALALVVLIATWPVALLASVAIKRSSPGPVIYRAQRVGQAGATFTMFKLRTMHVGADESGGITTAEDARVFPVGVLIRRLKIDELPQLVNILRGEMAFVGPRPEDPTIVHRYYEPWMWETLAVPPGLTSPGSLVYFSREHELPADPGDAELLYAKHLMPVKLARDLVYVRRCSLRYKFELVLRTLAGIAGLHRLAEGWRRREDDAAHAILDQARRNL